MKTNSIAIDTGEMILHSHCELAHRKGRVLNVFVLPQNASKELHRVSVKYTICRLADYLAR